MENVGSNYFGTHEIYVSYRQVEDGELKLIFTSQIW